MNLAVSSIAWTNEEETAVAEKLRELGVKRVELAPTKMWEDPTHVSIDEARRVVEWWAGFDINVVAFQSMLFARPDLKLFQDATNRHDTLVYLKNFVTLAGTMGVKKMVFGSPKNRQRGDVNTAEAFRIARDFFGEIAATAEENNVVFCLEPNAPQYACDFIMDASEGAELVKAVKHPGFGLHLDTACMTLAGDDMAASIRRYSDILEHFHISSPMLEQVEAREDINHEAAAEALRDSGYSEVISIEMRPNEPGLNVARVERAVRFAQATYLN